MSEGFAATEPLVVGFVVRLELISCMSGGMKGVKKSDHFVVVVRVSSPTLELLAQRRKTLRLGAITS